MAQAVDEAGNIWEVDAQGNAVRFIGKQGAPQSNTLITKQASPTFPYEGPKAAADLTKTTVDNEIAIATKGDAIRKAAADAAKAEADAVKAAREAASATTPAELQKARAAQVQAARGLHNQLDRVESLYDQNFRNNGIGAIGEFNPWSGANKQFDAAANVLMPFVKPLARTPGEGATDKSEYQDYRDLLPSGTAFDSTNDERILGLREMANSILRENGLPEYTRQQLATGETRREVDPVASGIIDRMIRQGKSAEEINAVLTPLGFNAIGQGDVASAQEYLRKNPKYDKSVGRAERVLPVENPMLNAALQTAPGTAAATYLNAGGFGIPQALNPQAFEALREENPMSAFAGDVGGIITGTSLINKAGQQTVGRLLPAAVTNNPTTLQKFANFGRQLAPDATYGAIYGGVTEGDPLTGAATATAGSAGGQLLGKGLQKGFQGVSDPAVQYLTGRGIPLSIGETFGNNSIIGRQMQRMESLPLLGDMMSARRGEARDAVYRATLEDAVAPVGGAINAADPLASAQQAISGAYDNAIGNVTVPFDARYFDELGNARNAASTLPPDLKGKFDAALASRVDAMGNTIASLPAPTKLNTPRVPTVDEMNNFSQVGEVPLSSARAGQSKMAWEEQNSGKFSEPLIPGFADRPVAVRLENGEFIIIDGNHRAVRAFNEGRETMPAYVIDAKTFDPGNAATRQSQETMNTDELLSALHDAGFSMKASSTSPQTMKPSAMTGQQYQQSMRGLSGYKSEATKPGFEQDYRDAISMVQDALKGQMMRGGGDTVVTGLRNADQAYSMLKPVEAATISARGTPTPKQLLSAFTNNTKKYGGTAAAARGDKVPDVVRYAAENAPNIGNSGTADRLAGIMPFILPTTLGGSAAGLETFTDSPFLTGTLATLAALSTKTGQRATQAALTKRPKAIKRLGGIFGRRETQKGLAGMVTAPLLIEN